MNENLTNSEFYKKLPEDVKEKLKGCKSEEEAMDILKNNMIELPEDELKKIAGGSYMCQGDLNCVTRIV